MGLGTAHDKDHSGYPLGFPNHTEKPFRRSTATQIGLLQYFVRPNDMTPNIHVERATVNDAEEIAVMVGELLTEIMKLTGVQSFHFNLEGTAVKLKSFLDREKYIVFVARCEKSKAVGFVTLYESYALYAEGTFGTIPEFYVRPAYRCNGVGFRLLSQAKSFGVARSWKRLEVTTPPLPEFERTLAFYERQGFAVTGGPKLKTAL